MLVAQGLHDAQDLVVGLALRQAGGQVVGQGLGLEEQAAARFLVAGGVELQPRGNVRALGAGKGVERAVAQFVVDFDSRDLDSSARMSVKTLVKDQLAIQVGASQLPWSRQVSEFR